MNKKVVLINQNAGYLMIDIANIYASHYDAIVLIAGIVRPMGRPLNSSIKIQKIIKYNRTSTFKRVFTWSWGSLQIFFLLLYKYRKYEIIYTTNPPIASFSSLLIKNKFSIIVYDTYPDALKTINFRDKGLIYKWWGQWNMKLFIRAERIFTLSNGMADQLGNYVDRAKIKVIPNWSGLEKLTVFTKEENPFIKENNLNDKFIVLYSGNLGYTHSVETIIEVAKILKHKENICFLIIGEGKKKEKLIKIAKDCCLNNCIFMTWQSTDLLQYSLASADLAIITINEDSATLSVPSKTYNLLVVGAPLLCIAPDNSELSLLVKKYKNGVCYSKDRTGDIAEYIDNLSRDKELQGFLFKNSVEASKDFTYANAQNYL